jgi:hypothetical protein
MKIILSGVPPDFRISTQQQNGDQMEEPPWSTNYPDKYSLSQFLVDKPDPELRPVLEFISHQKYTFRSPGFMDQRSIVLYHNRKGLTAQVILADRVATPGEEASA